MKSEKKLLVFISLLILLIGSFSFSKDFKLDAREKNEFKLNKSSYKEIYFYSFNGVNLAMRPVKRTDTYRIIGMKYNVGLVNNKNNDIISQDFLSIYPNPAFESVFIKSCLLNDSDFRIDIYTLDGEIKESIYHIIQIDSEKIKIGLSNYNIGYYILKLNINGKTQTGNFIIVK